MALFQRFNNICIWYKRFVNQMSPLKLFLLAVLSSASAVYFLYRSNLACEKGENKSAGEKGENKSEVMMYSSFLVLYLLLLGGYIFIYRRPDNEDAAVSAANPPAQAIQLREARCFSNSSLHTSAMAFFFFVDEPLKSNQSGLPRRLLSRLAAPPHLQSKRRLRHIGWFPCRIFQPPLSDDEAEHLLSHRVSLRPPEHPVTTTSTSTSISIWSPSYSSSTTSPSDSSSSSLPLRRPTVLPPRRQVPTEINRFNFSFLLGFWFFIPLAHLFS